MVALFHRIIDRCVEIFITLSIAILVIVTFGQVVGRYVFGYSYGWAEELCVLIFIWTVWTSACLLLRDNRHLSVTVIIYKVPRPYRLVIKFIMGVFILVFLGLIVYGSFGTLEAMAGIDFIALGLPLNWKFISVPVGAVLMGYYTLRVLFSKPVGD